MNRFQKQLIVDGKPLSEHDKRSGKPLAPRKVSVEEFEALNDDANREMDLPEGVDWGNK